MKLWIQYTANMSHMVQIT